MVFGSPAKSMRRRRLYGATRARTVECFQPYMAHDGLTVSRAEFEANLTAKIRTATFREDIRPLVSADVAYDPAVAVQLVQRELLARLPGEPWKGLDR